MKLSVQLFASRRDGQSASDALDCLVEHAAEAEAQGYQTVWLAEHHDTDWNLVTDPLTVLGYLASATKRIRLGAGVVNLGLHHPVAIAERAALVQALSDNRLELGLGKGFAAADYRRFGLDPAQRDGRFRAAYSTLLSELRSDPRTAGIPVWLSTTGGASTLQLAAEQNHGLLLASTGTKLRRVVEQVDRWPRRPRLAVARALHVAGDSGHARAEAAPYVQWYIDQLARLQPDVSPPPLDEVLAAFCILGTAEDCRTSMIALAEEYGIDELIAVPGIGGMPFAHARAVLRALATAM